MLKKWIPEYQPKSSTLVHLYWVVVSKRLTGITDVYRLPSPAVSGSAGRQQEFYRSPQTEDRASGGFWESKAAVMRQDWELSGWRAPGNTLQISHFSTEYKTTSTTPALRTNTHAHAHAAARERLAVKTVCASASLCRGADSLRRVCVDRQAPRCMCTPVCWPTFANRFNSKPLKAQSGL